MSSEKITVQKLKGASNYEVWALRMKSLLIKEGLEKAIETANHSDSAKALANIHLLCEDGPLLQIQQLKTAKEAWTSLKQLYSASGFTSEFLLIKEFFETTLSKYSSMEEYLNKVKQLSDQLKAKEIELPNQVIIAWVLNNLSPGYEGFVSNVIQSLRSDPAAYTLESLFSNLLDESKRFSIRDEADVAVKAFLAAKLKKGFKSPKKAYKITRANIALIVS